MRQREFDQAMRLNRLDTVVGFITVLALLIAGLVAAAPVLGATWQMFSHINATLSTVVAPPHR